MEKASADQRELDAAERDLERAAQNKETARSRISQIRTRIAEATSELTEAETALENCETEVRAQNDKVSQASKAVVDTGDLRQKYNEGLRVNKLVANKKQKKELADRADRLKLESQAMTEGITDLDEEKASRIAACEYPIDGLSVDGETVRYNGVCIDQASDGEKIEILTAMGLALDPEFKVLLLRQASLLDDNTLDGIERRVEEAHGQIWAERTGDVGTVVFENGRIKEAAETAD